ncbi:Ser/Thr protein kinase [Cryptosporidium canis]|uniref:Ser/Thr protein kinase n=1 Tax=Cryptosporidium canis TaxID=195482 RepID=A0A9D5DDS8_9CRYT|nr:Ser/Thr protein kinase [Cryptosporidium canis]
MAEKGEDSEDSLEYIKTEIIWIPNFSSRPEIFVVEDFLNIQKNEILAINAIYGSVTIHNDRSGSIGNFLLDQCNLVVFSNEVEGEFNNKDGVEVRVLFIPGGDEILNQEAVKSRYIVESNYEGSSFTVYSLVLSRGVSEAMPFKNRRYWRITDLYARVTVYYGDKYPIENPALLFEFSLELPKSIYTKLVEEIKEILVNRTGDQECIFQVISCLEMILDDLCDYLLISEDLWEQMRRQNNQREFEKHLDNSALSVESEHYMIDSEDNFVSGINQLGRRNKEGEVISIERNKEFESAKKSEMVSGFLDDTILDYSLNTSEIADSGYISNNAVNLDWSYIKSEHNINYSLLSSKRFSQDFRVLDILYSGRNVIITKSLHLIDQNNYQVSIYRISSERFIKIQARVSSLVMLQQSYMARYYQCWVEKCDNKNDERNDHEKFVLLYIQSEFMGENMTLLDFMEKGKITNREDHVIWSLFRQILEILSYCHRNKVFHLSLSSNCIYIEEDIYGYSVKLSNFIFGSHLNQEFDSNDDEFSLPGILFTESSKLAEKILKIDIECTAQIFSEMWLRIKYKGLEYEKSYSKLFEWFDQLEISNEHILVGEMSKFSLDVSKNIDEFFLFNKDLPSDFKYIPKTALLVIKKLLSQCACIQESNIDDLLKSDLLPNSINKNEFQYYLTRICNPKTYESHITLNTLFRRNIDMMSSAAFLKDIQSDEQVNIIDLTFCDIVKTSITKILDDHNFVLWKLPILYPTQFLMDKGINIQLNNSEFENLLIKCGYRTRDPHFLLDISNNLLCLPKSAPFSMICSLVSLLVGDILNGSSGIGANSPDFENRARKGSGNGIEGMSNTNNMVINGCKLDEFQGGGTFSGIFGVTLEAYYKHLNMYINENSPIQRYALLPIYEQPKSNTDSGENVFSPPRAKLSLAFDMIYQLGELVDHSVGGNNSGLSCNDSSTIINQELLNIKTSEGLFYDDLKRIYQIGNCGQISCMENIILEVEGLLLTLKLILPWLDYLDDLPIVRLTIPLMTKIVYLELLEKLLSGRLLEDEILKRRELNIFTQKNSFKEMFTKDNISFVDDEIIESFKLINELFTEMHSFEWKYERNIGSYRLKSIYENRFIIKSYEYIRDNSIIKLYVQVLNEILNVLSESTDLLIYNDKKVRFYFDPIMDYDINLYDQTSLVYSITSEKMGIELVYGMGGSYSQKINWILGHLYTNTLEGCINPITGNTCLNHNMDLRNIFTNNTSEGLLSSSLGLISLKSPNIFSCIMGEVSIELLIKQVCEMAKKYRAEFVNTGGYIKGISVNDISNIINDGVLTNGSLIENINNTSTRRGHSWMESGCNGPSNSSLIGRNKSSSALVLRDEGKLNDIKILDGDKHSLAVCELDGMTDLSRELLLKPISLLKSCYPRVIIMTQTVQLQSKVLSLTRRLWQNGIRSEYRLTPVRSLSVFLEKLKRNTLVELLIIVMYQNNNTGVGMTCSFNSISNLGGVSGVMATVSSNMISATMNSNIGLSQSVSNLYVSSSINQDELSSPGNMNPSMVHQDSNPHSSGDHLGNFNSTSTLNTSSSSASMDTSITLECGKSKNIIFRIEPISGLYYEAINSQTFKVIFESEESVVNYVVAKRRRQIIN